MSVWSNYWRIVTPSSRKSNYQTQTAALRQDGSDNGFASVSSTTWFSNVMRGATTRLTSYKQYDSMDSGDVARALDVIAEEISNPDKRTDLPFTIDYQTEENQDVSDTTTTTLRAALRQWAKLHSLNKRVFDIAREMCKYGDCFFRKKSDTQKWEYVDPTRIIGVEIDANTGEKLAYHLKPQEFRNSQYAREESVEIVPAEGIIHFTLSNDMGGTTPFGMSLLQDAYHDWQKLRMLEDSAIIYRIVRAPERRVFYIDVGNQPAHKVKQYLEQIRNEIRQKRVPNAQNSTQADGQYNPECLALDTLIPLLDGRTLTLAEMIAEHESGKVNWVYSCDPVTGELKPGEVAWAGVTRKNAETLTITLDNSHTITCTPDHMFPVQGLGFVRADELTADMSLVPFNRKWASDSKESVVPFHEGYEHVYDVSTKSWTKTHLLVRDNVALKNSGLKQVVHHVDFNKHNNSPDNLLLMGSVEHFQYHAEHNKERFDSWSKEKQESHLALLRDGLKEYHDSVADEKISNEEFRRAQISSTNQKNSKVKTIRRDSGLKRSLAQRLNVSDEIVSLLSDKIKRDTSVRRLDLLDWMATDNVFVSAFSSVNQPSKSGRRSAPTWTYLEVIKEDLSARNFTELKSKLALNNHKIVAIKANTRQDTGCITVGENVHKYHTFALESGVFARNSIQEDYYFPVTAAGRGSRVETIAGGGTWETPELDHFLAKVFRALRVPSSYMRGADSAGAQYSDGKVGIAYIEELRFANFIMRLQSNLEDVFDAEFKTYLAVVGINIDPDLFKLSLPEPQNFALYRQSQLDTDLINSFKSIGDTAFLSKRFMLNRYLGLTLEEIQMNEAMLKEEKGIIDDIEVPALRQIYDENAPKVNTASEPEVPVDDGNAFGLGAPEEPVAGEQPPLEDDAPSTDILDEPAPQ